MSDSKRSGRCIKCGNLHSGSCLADDASPRCGECGKTHDGVCRSIQQQYRHAAHDEKSARCTVCRKRHAGKCWYAPSASAACSTFMRSNRFVSKMLPFGASQHRKRHSLETQTTNKSKVKSNCVLRGVRIDIIKPDGTKIIKSVDKIVHSTNMSTSSAADADSDWKSVDSYPSSVPHCESETIYE